MSFQKDSCDGGTFPAERAFRKFIRLPDGQILQAAKVTAIGWISAELVSGPDTRTVYSSCLVAGVFSGSKAAGAKRVHDIVSQCEGLVLLPHGQAFRPETLDAACIQGNLVVLRYPGAPEPIEIWTPSATAAKQLLTTIFRICSNIE